MELESGLPFKFYFENIDKFGRIIPNNLSKNELDEYNALCSEKYNWNQFVMDGKTKKTNHTFFISYIVPNELATTDINEKNLIYLCEAFTPPSFYDNKFVENMSENVYNKLKNKEIIVLFNWFSEPQYDEIFNSIMEKLCKENNFNPSNFVVFTSGNNIVNTSKLHYISDHFFISTSANFLKYFLQNKIFKPNQFDYVCEIVNQDVFDNKKTKHFISLNRHVDRPHRYGLGLFLEKHNMWEKGNFTFLVCDKPKKNDELIEVFDENTANDYSIYGDAFHKKIPLEIDTQKLMNNVQFGNFGTSHIYYKPIYENSAFNIITETTFKNNTVFLSEKTFHPIINLQPFIMFASNGQLKELQKLGFKTFGDIIDESYDNETNSKKRFEMVCNEIKKLSELNIDEINELFLKCKDVCIYNRNHLLSFTKYDVYENSIEKLKKIKWNLQEKRLL